MTGRQFLWAYGEALPSPDPAMTPERAARLLRAWRGQMRTRVNGPRYFKVRLLRHTGGWREYRVKSRYGESASLWIGPAA